MRRLVIWLLVAFLLCGCAISEVPEMVSAESQPEPKLPVTEETQPTETIPQETVDPRAEALALMELPPVPVSVVLMPKPSGELEERCDEAVIDYSHIREGYVMVQYTAETDVRLKVLVQGPETTYAYNLPQKEWTVFPLSDGDGTYTVGVYSNVTGNKYATVMSVSFPVELEDEFAPFLRPNQYVDYAAAPETVALGAVLTQELEHPLEKVAVIYDYVVHNFEYDYEKAETVKSGYLPELDKVLEEKRGICFDYAAMMTAMLRSQQVPCKLVVGYAGDIYHAWISVWTEEDGWIDGAIFFDGHVWHRMDPTFASSGAGDERIMDFIQNGTYRVKYLY